MAIMPAVERWSVKLITQVANPLPRIRVGISHLVRLKRIKKTIGIE